MPNGSPGVSDFAEGQYLDPMCMRPWWYLWKTGGEPNKFTSIVT